MDPDGAFLFFGAREKIRNNNAHYPFRQDSHFYYLTEFTEPDSILVMVSGKSILFVRPRDENEEVWVGERYGVERAKQIFGVDECYSIQDFSSRMEGLLSGARTIYYALGSDAQNDLTVVHMAQDLVKHSGRGRHSKPAIVDPTAMLSKLRMVKDSTEIERLRNATEASVFAHVRLLEYARPGLNEFDLFREFQYAVLKNGGNDLGYGAIVASGKNATVLHYVDNNMTLQEGDLILVDAGGECEYYTADITQTFPVGKTFSPKQKSVYEKVLSVNQEITKLMKPGMTYRKLQETSIELLTEALLSLGVLQGTLAENLANKSYRAYYMHGIGHHLGLDVHDAALYDERGKDFELEAGMVMTNEPGLYFRDPASPFYGIGVRIEDDILITSGDADVLTKALPRKVEQIEAIRAKAY